MKLCNNIWLPDGDTFFQQRGDYELADYQHVMRYCEQRRVAIDCGAHVGYWSRRLVKDFQHVHAFEPVPEHHECLVANTHEYKNITLYNTAVSSVGGSVFMRQAVENSGMSTVSTTATELEVDLITIDSVGIADVDLIKIDVEGHEHNVLIGAQNTILKYEPLLFVEILHAHRSSSPVFDLLKHWGYTQILQVQENYLFVSV
jgi:FkbM family methyltransferase